MSAYGPIPSRHDTPTLPTTRWALGLKPGTQSEFLSLTVHHLTSATAPPELAALLHAHFDAELQRGATYPQECPITRTAFDNYFLAANVFVAILQTHTHGDDPQSPLGSLSVNDSKGTRQWDNCLGGAYYVKPNYPGRSSHICNAGFLVPPDRRGLGIATALARSYLYYAPRLGFKASIFNLVYVNNVASVKIWDKLGFEKIGRIPAAGRLKRREEDGGGEEYVDAWVVYKSFEGQE